MDTKSSTAILLKGECTRVTKENPVQISFRIPREHLVNKTALGEEEDNVEMEEEEEEGEDVMEEDTPKNKRKKGASKKKSKRPKKNDYTTVILCGDLVVELTSPFFTFTLQVDPIEDNKLYKVLKVMECKAKSSPPTLDAIKQAAIHSEYANGDTPQKRRSTINKMFASLQHDEMSPLEIDLSPKNGPLSYILKNVLRNLDYFILVNALGGNASNIVTEDQIKILFQKEDPRKTSIFEKVSFATNLKDKPLTLFLSENNKEEIQTIFDASLLYHQIIDSGKKQGHTCLIENYKKPWSPDAIQYLKDHRCDLVARLTLPTDKGVLALKSFVTQEKSLMEWLEKCTIHLVQVETDTMEEEAKEYHNYIHTHILKDNKSNLLGISPQSKRTEFLKKIAGYTWIYSYDAAIHLKPKGDILWIDRAHVLTSVDLLRLFEALDREFLEIFLCGSLNAQSLPNGKGIPFYDLFRYDGPSIPSCNIDRKTIGTFPVFPKPPIFCSILDEALQLAGSAYYVVVSNQWNKNKVRRLNRNDVNPDHVVAMDDDNFYNFPVMRTTILYIDVPAGPNERFPDPKLTLEHVSKIYNLTGWNASKQPLIIVGSKNEWNNVICKTKAKERNTTFLYY